MNFPQLKNIKNLADQKVLLRLDLNVAIKDGNITEDFRIKKILPTLNFLLEARAKVIIIAHLDDKEGSTLEPVSRYLSVLFPRLVFVKDIYSLKAKNELAELKPGNIVFFDNIRQWEGEKANDPKFAKYLASLADIYVNDAFSASHRKHASIVGVPEFLPSYFGPLFSSEVAHLSKAFNPEHPFLFILGGAKFETKIPVLNKFLPLCDKMFIGGAIANDFYKAQGHFIGDSLVSEDNFNIPELLKNQKIILPIDVRTQHKGMRYIKKPNEISVGEKIWDMGDKSAKALSKIIKEASFVVWNGPVGNIEVGESAGTIEIGRMIAGADCTSIVGGGDTIAALEKTEYFSKFSFVSSGGGAMLDFLADETLPGIEAIKKNSFRNITRSPKSWFKRLFS